ncbi:uncharacterized protein LOC144307035 isoform X1 [Canis aureus]
MEDCPSLIQSNAHIYSDLPASVRSERGLPRESGLVLCSPECPSGARTAPHSWHIKTHPLEIPQKWEASPFLSGQTNVQYNIPVSSASLPAIKSLGLRGITCVGLTNLDGLPASHQVLEAVAYHLGPHLQSLCLSGGSPTEASFVALVLGCPALRILDLSGCNSLFVSGMLMAQPEMAQLVQQVWSGLRELNLAGLRDLTDLSFSRLCHCAPNLERLSLAYCHLTFELGPAQGSLGPQDFSCSQLSFHNLLQFVKERAGRLCGLDLSGTGLLPEAAKALAQVAGLQLKELSLRACQDLSTGAVAALCRLQSGLTSLDLSGCSELADGALLAISRGLACLQCLRLRKLQRLTDTGCTVGSSGGPAGAAQPELGRVWPGERVGPGPGPGLRAQSSSPLGLPQPGLLLLTQGCLSVLPHPSAGPKPHGARLILLCGPHQQDPAGHPCLPNPPVSPAPGLVQGAPRLGASGAGGPK